MSKMMIFKAGILAAAVFVNGCVDTTNLIDAVESEGGFEAPAGSATPLPSSTPTHTPQPTPTPTPTATSIVDTTPPSIAITSPGAGTVAKDGLVLQGTCETGLSLAISGEGLSAASTTTCSSGSFSVEIVFSSGDGVKNIVVSQTDSSGNQGSAHREFFRDSTPPHLTIDAPSAGTAAKTGVTIQGTCETGLPISLSGAILGSPISGSCEAGTYSVGTTFAGSDGTKSIAVSQVDAAGNTSAVTRDFQKKSTAPSVTIDSPAADTRAKSGVTLHGTCQADIATVALSGTGLASPSSTACNSGTYTVEIIFTNGDGTKNIIASQTDGVGNKGETSRNFIRDNSAPNVSIISPQAGTSAKTGITLTGTCETGLSMTLSGDGIGLPVTTSCASGTFSQAITFTNGDGLKQVSVTQTSLSGVPGVVSRDFYRDNTQPNLSITSPAANTRAKTGLTITGTCEDGTSVSLTGAVNPSPTNATCTAEGAFTVNITFTTGDGNKAISFSQTDGAGNSSSTSRTFVRDNTPPDIAIQSPASFTAARTGLTITGKCEVGWPVALSGSGLLSSASATCTGTICQLEGCPGTFSAEVSFSSGDGIKPISASQTDSAENTKTDSRSYTRDNTPPGVSITSPEANSNSTGSITLSGGCDSSAGNVLIEGDIPAPLSASCISNLYSQALTFAGGDGVKSLTVKQSDSLGNEGIATRGFNKDTTPPGSISIDSPAANAYINSQSKTDFTISGSCSEQGAGNVEVKAGALSLGTVNCSAGSFTGQFDFTTVAEGSVSLIAVHSDAAGNTKTSTSVSITKDTLIPSPTSINDGTWNASTSSSPTISWNSVADSGSGLNRYEVALGTASGGENTATWSSSGILAAKQFSIALSDGQTYYASVRAVDNAGNISSVTQGDGFVVDVTGPTAPSSVTLGEVPDNLTSTPTITFTSAADAVSGTSRHEVKIVKTSDSSIVRDWATHTSGSAISGISPALAASTQYSALVRGVDAAGNNGTSSAAANWTSTTPVDPCNGTPARATVCTGGALYVGQFDGGKYMVTPGGCSDIPGNAGQATYSTTDFTPNCSGGTDTVTKYWNSGSGTAFDIPGVQTITSETTASSSSYRGDVNQAAIVAITSSTQGGYHAAARYCDKLNYGGYTDWYLPSKSELAYLYCHSSVSGHSAAYPQEAPNCAAYGGKTSELTGFANNAYWSSTEYSSSVGWYVSFSTGFQNGSNTTWSAKTQSWNIRCVRRY